MNKIEVVSQIQGSLQGRNTIFTKNSASDWETSFVCTISAASMAALYPLQLKLMVILINVLKGTLSRCQWWAVEI